MLSTEMMIELGPQNEVEQGDNLSEDGDDYKLEMLNFGDDGEEVLESNTKDKVYQQGFVFAVQVYG